MVAWRRIDEVPFEPIAWLLGVARKVLANERRATSRRAALTERVTAVRVLEDDPSHAVTDRMHALQALGRLGAWDREVLMLMAWERLDYKSAAAVMGCSPSVFKIRLHRARRKLAEILDVPAPTDAERSLLASKPQEAR
jgi:RNA polymerase sigma-70 factor (ECF subfamily)